jgi:hypothetical protein
MSGRPGPQAFPRAVRGSHQFQQQQPFSSFHGRNRFGFPPPMSNQVTDVTSIFAEKKLAKTWAVFARTAANFCKNLITFVYEETPVFLPK